ncbi:MAG TPA: hypothetical protein VK178_07040 [Opitutaceae bacterium]|nr:hypothetical protein [Opitutaceae bacterium]
MRIKTVVQHLLEGIRNTGTEADREEAKDLLQRLEQEPVARPAPSGIRYARAQKKGGRRG